MFYEADFRSSKYIKAEKGNQRGLIIDLTTSLSRSWKTWNSKHFKDIE